MKWILPLTHEEEITIATYEAIAPLWKEKHADSKFWRRSFAEFQELLPEGHVIDIGCGCGKDASFFLGAGYDYTGIDASGAMLAEAAKAVPAERLSRMTFYDLEFPDETFDGFWASASFLHVPKNRIRHVLKEARRVTKPSGIGFISVKMKLSPRKQGLENVPYHPYKPRFFAYYEQNEFAFLLTGNGFEVVRERQDWRLYNDRPESQTVFLCYLVRRDGAE